MFLIDISATKLTSANQLISNHICSASKDHTNCKIQLLRVKYVS